MNADFVANKIPVEFIKEEAFWGTYSRDIYFGVNGTRYRETLKDFNELQHYDQNY